MPAGHASKTEVSAELLEAQQRLLELRLTLPSRPRPSAPAPAPEIGVTQQIANAQKELRRRRQLAGIEPTKNSTPDSFCPKIQYATRKNPPKSSLNKASNAVAVYPSLLLAMLKQDQAAAGRVYLLLRLLDKSGRGWLPVEEIRERLTHKASPLKVIGWRRLRQIFRQGDGVFWERDRQDRLWLRSATRIAQDLGCDRLRGKRVELPITALLGGIGTVRAHFYASFHSGRGTDNPISRDTLSSITGLSPRTQREYDRVAKVKRQRNMAVGPKHTKVAAEEQYWQRGGAVFRFVDSQGKQGPKNREYLAWQLPNSYQASHQQRPGKGRQKKINQKLVSLVENGVQGNDQREADKLFWPDGAAAGKAYSRDQSVDAYWPRGETRQRKVVVWYALVGEVE